MFNPEKATERYRQMKLDAAGSEGIEATEVAPGHLADVRLIMRAIVEQMNEERAGAKGGPKR